MEGSHPRKSKEQELRSETRVGVSGCVLCQIPRPLRILIDEKGSRTRDGQPSRWESIQGRPAHSTLELNTSAAQYGVSDEKRGHFLTSEKEGKLPSWRPCPTGCATRLQQADCVVRSGLTSDPGHIACFLVTWEKFRWSCRNHACNDERSRAIFLERCISLRNPWAERVVSW